MYHSTMRQERILFRLVSLSLLGLFVMKHIFLILIQSLSVVFLHSCSQDIIIKDIHTAEKYIQCDPEQALSLLESIDKNSLTTQKSKAEYSLLYSIALDKNFIDTTNIEIAMPAVKYYDKHGPNEKAMKSWFYLGREQENSGDYNNAIVSYTKAKEFAEKTDDTRFKALLASGMSDLYAKTYNDEEHIFYAEEAYNFYKESCDTLNCWIAIGVLAEAYTNTKMWDKADSLYNVFFSYGIIDSYQTPYYKLSYASKLVRQPEPAPGKAIELIEDAINNFNAELSSYDFGVYAYAHTLLGNYSVNDQFFNYCETEEIPDNTYTWKYDIFKELGEYQKALYELEKIFHNQEKMIDSILSQSISRTQRDYFQAKAKLIEQDRNYQKSVKTVVILISLLIIITAILIVYTIRRNLQTAKEKMASIQSESSIYSKELEKRIEEMSKEKIEHREDVIANLNKSYIQNYRAQFKLIDELCAEYWMSERNRDKERIYNKVNKIVNTIYNGSGKNSEFETKINSCLDNVMQKLRIDFPKFKEEDFRLLSYVIAGFEAKTISMIMDQSTSNIYSRKSRMKEKILSANTENVELYRICLK